MKGEAQKRRDGMLSVWKKSKPKNVETECFPSLEERKIVLQQATNKIYRVGNANMRSGKFVANFTKTTHLIQRRTNKRGLLNEKAV